MSADPALDFILANDPEAQGMSRRAYARKLGITNGSQRRDINHREHTFAADDKALPWHCPCCYKREVVRRHTVE